jgi:thiol-disulfide isomerase/thioredoxin
MWKWQRIAVGVVVLAVLGFGGLLLLSPKGMGGEGATENGSAPAGVPAAGREPAATPATPQAVSAEPIFASSFKDFNRKLQPLEQWRGKVTLVYFWATWCKPCRTEVPALIALYSKYRERDLAVVGIAIDQTDRVREFAEEYEINYDVLIGGNDALDLSRKMGNGIGGLPFLVVIDRQGNVAATELGQLTEDRLEQIVAPLLS